MPSNSDTAASTAGKPAGEAPEPWSLRAFNGPVLGQMTEAGQSSLAAMAHMHSRVFRDALRFNAEVLDFASRRVRADLEATNRLARCESVTEAMDVISEFYQGALEDYADESTALVRLGSGAGDEGIGEAMADAARLNERKTD